MPTLSLFGAIPSEEVWKPEVLNKVLKLGCVRVAVLLACSLMLGGCVRRALPWTPNPIHTPPKPDTGEFNVVWDQIDVNGFPHNPYWAAQGTPYPQSPPPLHGAKYDDGCVQEPNLTKVAPGKQACTVQPTTVDRPEEFPNSVF